MTTRYARSINSLMAACRRRPLAALAIAALPAPLVMIGATGVAHAKGVALDAVSSNPAPVEIEDVVNVIGFDQLRRGSDGMLAFRNKDLFFAADRTTGTIPLEAIRSFTLERSTTGLMHGTGGKIIGSIPRGVGNLYHAIRRDAHELTIYYADKDQALHGVVLILPKERDDDVLAAFAGVGLQHSFPSPPIMPPLPSVPFRPIIVGTALSGGKPSVSIMPPSSSSQALPAAYHAAIYEQLHAELTESGLFGKVWRYGDARVPVDALILRISVKEFKKGNPGRRGGIPVFGVFVGKTLITADMTLASPSGNILLHREVKGSKRMSGESIGAAKSLAQRVSQSIEEAPGFDDDRSGTKIAAR